MKTASFETFAEFLLAGSGLAIGPDKIYLLENRLGPLLDRHDLADLDALADRLRHLSPRAVVAGSLGASVIEAMTTNESFFFRDGKPFTHFRTVALPRLLAARPAHARLRLWSAAASSGQEAYSLAMILSECRAQLGGRAVDIVGTDISPEQIQRAQEGVYTQFEVQRGLPIQSLVRHFRKYGANWRVSDELRAMAQFRTLDLLSDLRAVGQFDIVFCRNVLIYFDRPTKTRVLEAIARQMPPDGLLYLGGAETVLGITTSFAALQGERGVYERACVDRAAAPVPAARGVEAMRAAVG